MGEDLNYVDMEDVDGGMHGTIDEADGDAPAPPTTATPPASPSTYHGNLSTNENPEIQEVFRPLYSCLVLSGAEMTLLFQTLHDDVV